VRTRLKVFYRPAGLPGTPGGVVNTLRWRLSGEAGAMKIICENPSAFNVSLARISLYATDRPNEEVKGMCPAKGSAAFTLEGTETGKVYFTTISDYGGFARHSAVYTG
jgi:chaperone protein EcpD